MKALSFFQDCSIASPPRAICRISASCKSAGSPAGRLAGMPFRRSRFAHRAGVRCRAALPSKRGTRGTARQYSVSDYTTANQLNGGANLPGLIITTMLPMLPSCSQHEGATPGLCGKLRERPGVPSLSTQLESWLHPPFRCHLFGAHSWMPRPFSLTIFNLHPTQNTYR